jgi:amino acid adenylation domain-containing protein
MMASPVVAAAREIAWTEPDASATDHADSLGRWALQHLAAGGSENPVRVWRLAGSPAPDALLAALREVLGRHDILRTCYPERGGMVAPRLLPARALGLRTLDTRAAAIAALLRAETARPFDVAHDLPVRALLLLLPSGEQRLAVVAHGLCCDAGSLDLIGAELDGVLTDAAQGAPAPPFADHAGWLLRRFAGPEMEADLVWWRAALAGVPPADLPPDAAPDSAPVGESLALPPALATLLAGIADDAAGPDPLLAPAAAALAVLLRRWTGEADMLLGAEMSGRRPGLDAGTVGRFATLVALRLDLSGDPLAATLLARARHAAEAAWARRHVPFHRLAEILDGEAGWTALLPVRLAVRRAPPPGKHLAALPGPVAAPHGRLGLALRLEADGSAWLDAAAAGAYRAETVRRVLSGWALALAALLQSPDTKVAAIDVLTEAERRHLLSLNDTARAWPETPAIRLIEARAREAPARVALLCGEDATSYGDLLDDAERLAAALRARGIGRGARVGLLLPRGAEMVTALLAVQKAGAAYVPLDPALPPERIADMLADSGAALVVAHSALRDRLAGAATPRLELDRESWRESAPVVAPDIAPDDEAYVIYTSGSTGRPKGVAVPHRALANFLRAMHEAPGMDAADTMLFATTLSFDIAALEIHLPLLVGARVAIATDDEAADGAALADLVARHRVGIVQAGPTRLELMLDAGWRPHADGPALRILTGGEKVSRALARRLAPLGEVWNMYGPTETTIWSTCRRIAAEDTDSDAGSVPIGRPIANTRVYVLDDAGGLAPHGAAGELCIAGHGVATGYVARPALTAERFPPDPFGPGRMYRTGDRVRWRHDDTLEFLSRLDDQIKLRGVRIEPGEVEAALLRHPGLRQALVVLGRDRTGEAALIAYTVPADPAAWPAIRRELPGLLAARLPRQMLPQALVMLPALPLLANGKIDRRRLPPPPALETQDAVGMEGVAQHLAAIWRDILKLPSVGLADNFFDLGGTSLLAARLQARIRDAFGRRISLAALYRAPRLADLADLVAREPKPEAPDAETVQIVHLQRAGEAPPVFGVNNTTVFYPVAMRLSPKRPFVAVEIRKLRALTQAPDADLTEIAATYLAAVRAIRPHGPYVLLGWCAGAVLAYDIAQQLLAQDEQVAMVAMVDPSPPGPVAGFGPRLIAAGQRLRTDVARHGGSVLRRLRPTAPAAAAAAAAEQDLDIVDRKLVAYLERAADAYRPRAYGGRVLLFAPDRARAAWMADPVAGWRALAPNAAVHRVPGDHVTMLRGDGARFIAERIGDALAGGYGEVR